jgi:sigma-B regulation protein RsbU (phosphoserine phosphatase)
LELIRKVRSSASEQYVYCILLTSKSQVEDLVQGMDAGADDFLTKPFDDGELRVRLNAGRRIIGLERSLSNANQRMQQELRTAATIQRSLLPVRLPERYQGAFAWSYKPCNELGGDILNVLPLSASEVALYLLDVSGKGVPAALLSVALSRLLTTTTNASSLIHEKDESASGYRIVAPREVLARLNQRFLLDLGGERFFTMMYGVLDLRSNRLCYASGGHNPALLLRPDGDVKKLASTGPLMGILEDATFEEDTITLQPRDRLLIYSDGVTEAADSHGEQFGIERLIVHAQAAWRNPLQEALNQMMQGVQDWVRPGNLQDDASCLMAQAAGA